ncbi:MAG: Stp1/IreP family PP2C-type Ser/Thr phosphatase [Deltaproteobacteria bacterium]|nr:Stp1/IreP family PP2C-type Ser/Thr phosphatase [Deltaproteobacteria bacterium]
MKLMAAGVSNVGMKRAHNEDSYRLVPEENLFVVADGMGGHASGEVASAIAVDSVEEFFKLTSADEEQTWPFKEERGLKYEENRLATSIKLANRRIYETAQADVRKRGMGTTVVTALFTHNGAYIGHCGDSRCYRFRQGKLELLTEDHSLLNDYLKNHKLTQEEIDNFPHKNVIVRALGMKDTVQVDISRLEPQPHDIYLLCSDGLSGMVHEPEMTERIGTFAVDASKANDIEGLCHVLIDAANKNGGTDNVTVVAIRVLP